MSLTGIILLALGAWLPPARAELGLNPVDLKCDGMTGPLGVDSSPPRLSWALKGVGRGQRQSGWQILAASSPGLLSSDRGDLWDSGQVASDRSFGVPYGGARLRSAEQVFWKVRVWDEQGRPSTWSEPGRWTMGLLAGPDWGARWITDPDLLRWVRPKLGFRSGFTSDPNTTVWLQVDLGRPLPIESVGLRAIQHTVADRFGFPLRFRLEVSDDPEFKAAVLVDDQSQADLNPWLSSLTVTVPGVRARYVRLTATRLRLDDRGRACLALSQIEVESGGRNAAKGAPVRASDSVEQGPWSASAATDGLGAPGANPRANGTLLLRREFVVQPGLRRALLFVCGEGQYFVECNGRPVGSDVLRGSWTDPAKTCLYDCRDVTGLIRDGSNAVGLCLAGGMYDVPFADGRYQKFVSAYRPPAAIAQLRLDYEDGSVEIVPTDAGWRAAAGPTTYANVYGGEDFDARKLDPDWSRPGFDDSGWRPSAEIAGPGGVLRGSSHADPTIGVRELLVPKTVRPLRSGVTVYDLGQNAALIPRIAVRGPAGATVRITPAELLNPDGSVDRRSSGGGTAYWQYTLSGGGRTEIWMPHFFYHGARYLQVELAGPPGGPLPELELIDGRVVSSDSDPAGEFECSNELFNRIHSLVRWAQRNNLMHVMTDCPHRERLGWLEQTHLNGPSLRYNFDLGRLYGKAFQDMEDAQQPDGLIPEIAPEYVVFSGDFRDSPEWGSALILAAWQQYEWTGDEEPLRAHYLAMKRYVGHLDRRSAGGLIDFGLGDWYDVGPARPGPAQLTPVALTATAFYCADCAALGRIASLLGDEADASGYRARAEAIRSAFNRRFYDAKAGRYAAGSQTAQALPLVLGLEEPADRKPVFDALVKDVEGRGDTLTAGDVGYRYLLLALAEGGRSDLIARMISRSDTPGYAYQLARGCTSLAEAWNADPRSSQDHFMLGQIEEWLYGWLAGLAPDPSAAGFRRAIVRPQPVPEVTWARASHQSACGRDEVSWTEARGKFFLDLVVPPNTAMEIRWPFATGADKVLADGAPATRSAAVRVLPDREGRPVFEIGSGRYEFVGQIGGQGPGGPTAR